MYLTQPPSPFTASSPSSSFFTFSFQESHAAFNFGLYFLRKVCKKKYISVKQLFLRKTKQNFTARLVNTIT